MCEDLISPMGLYSDSQRSPLLEDAPSVFDDLQASREDVVREGLVGVLALFLSSSPSLAMVDPVARQLCSSFAQAALEGVAVFCGLPLPCTKAMDILGTSQ